MAHCLLVQVLGVSAMTAIQLFVGSYKDGRFGPIRSVAELRANSEAVSTLSIPWVKKVEGEDGRTISIAVQQSLEHHEELQAPVPPESAVQMLEAVQQAARLAHNLIRGSNPNGESLACDCPTPQLGEALCRCCWHAEFVGGARCRGRAGHDVDILVWHHLQPSCVNGGKTGSDYLIYPLVRALEMREDGEGRLLSEAEGYQRIERRSDWQRRKQADGVHKHHRQTWMTWKTHNGSASAAVLSSPRPPLGDTLHFARCPCFPHASLANPERLRRVEKLPVNCS